MKSHVGRLAGLSEQNAAQRLRDGSSGEHNPKYGLQDQTDLIVQVDWDGNIVWKFDKAEYIEEPGEEFNGWPPTP